MSTTKDGGPAFPITLKPGERYQPLPQDGMTLRDYFAAHETLAEWDNPEAVLSKSVAESLAGPMPEGGWSRNPLETMKWEAKWRAAIRYIRADAMIAAREGGSK